MWWDDYRPAPLFMWIVEMVNPVFTARMTPRHIACVAGAALFAGAPVAAEAPGLAMLNELERGLWQLRDREGERPTQTICLGDARQMLQPRHAGLQCPRYVIEDSASSVTVHYSCPGAGHGRTTIRRETNRLVQVDTQGIVAGTPFSIALEGRRMGPCT